MSDAVKLKRHLGLFHGVCIICGVSLGSGIFISPKAVILATGSVGAALLFWLCGGLISLIGALCYAEIGTTIPVSGGNYAYLSYIFGKLPAYLYLWMYINLARPSANAIKTLIFAQYLTQLFYGGNEVCPPYIIPIVAICLIWLLSFASIVQVKWSAHIQTVFASLTVMILTVIFCMGIVHTIGNTAYVTPDVVFKDTTMSPGNTVMAMYSALYAYYGWQMLNTVTEEIKYPNRNLPLAIVISMVIITSLYTGVNFAYFTVLGPEVVKESDTVALDFALQSNNILSWFLPLGVASSIIGSLISGILFGSRATFVGGRSGVLPKILGFINIKFSSPITSIIYQAILMTVLCAFVDVYVLLTQLTFVCTFFDSLVILGMVYLRFRKPNLNRPIKMPLIIPITYLLFSMFLTVITLLYTMENLVFGIVIVLSGIPYYVLIQLDKRGKIPPGLTQINRRLLVIVQKSLYCCEES